MFGLTKKSISPSPSAIEEFVLPTKIEVTDANLPVCRGCQFELEAIKFIDYGDIRVVFHASNRCVIGVITKPNNAND